MTILLGLFAISALSATPSTFEIKKSKQPPVSPAWVFDHWVWEDDDNTQDAVFELVNGYAEHNIPVGAVVIDSPWSTEYNNFVWNREAYPDPEGMINKLHERGIKVILWATTMMNETSNSGNFEPKTGNIYYEAKKKGYLCNNGKAHKWWKGEGGFLDFTNQDARDWLHKMMDNVIDMGIDGWKTDGIASLFPSDGTCMTGPLSMQKYKDMYYMDMYEYIHSRNPQAISWSRSVDIRAANPKGFAPISHSPVNWVGDELHDWSSNGFIEAIEDVLDSGRLGYTVVGSDIAGYNGSMEISKQLLIRWAQFGALNPLMENGGHKAHEPWLHDQETTDIYRKFTRLHLELKPYLYSMMIKGHEKKSSIIHPTGGKYQYRLGDHLFASILYTEENSREVSFPSGKWMDYWEPGKFYSEDDTISYNCPLDRYPLFVRVGSIIPLSVVDGELGHGDDTFAGKITLDIVPGDSSRFLLCEEGRDRVPIALTMDGGKNFSVSAGTGTRPFIIRAYSDEHPYDVIVNGENIPPSENLSGLGGTPGYYFYDEASKRIFINPGSCDKLDVKVTFED